MASTSYYMEARAEALKLFPDNVVELRKETRRLYKKIRRDALKAGSSALKRPAAVKDAASSASSVAKAKKGAAGAGAGPGQSNYEHARKEALKIFPDDKAARVRETKRLYKKLRLAQLRGAHTKGAMVPFSGKTVKKKIVFKSSGTLVRGPKAKAVLGLLAVEGPKATLPLYQEALKEALKAFPNDHAARIKETRRLYKNLRRSAMSRNAVATGKGKAKAQAKFPTAAAETSGAGKDLYKQARMEATKLFPDDQGERVRETRKIYKRLRRRLAQSSSGVVAKAAGKTKAKGAENQLDALLRALVEKAAKVGIWAAIMEHAKKTAPSDAKERRRLCKNLLRRANRHMSAGTAGGAGGMKTKAKATAKVPAGKKLKAVPKLKALPAPPAESSSTSPAPAAAAVSLSKKVMKMEKGAATPKTKGRAKGKGRPRSSSSAAAKPRAKGKGKAKTKGMGKAAVRRRPAAAPTK